MIRKFPIIRPVAGLVDISRGFFLSWEACADEFCLALAGQTGKKFVYLADSGIACFYLALSVLKAGSDRREVVIPAYTAESLVVAIRKAGLIPVLCDIRMEDFNSGPEQLLSAISPKTLAIVAVHMFGIPINDIGKLKEAIPPEVCFIEDCCQAEGGKVNDLPVGSFGRISFFSFNRGKNFSLSGGGAIATDDPGLAQEISKFLWQAEKDPLFREFLLGGKIWLSSKATNPWVYGLVNHLIACFKENAPPKEIAVKQLSGLRGALARVLLPRKKDWFFRRNANGEYLSNSMRTVLGLRLAQIKAGSFPVYNRLPVLFEDTQILERKAKQLWNAGFENSRMYLLPLHHMFELGYRREHFPNARYLAEHLLTLPVYPGLEAGNFLRMIKVIGR
jgi:perosamine synthetase